MRMSRHTQIAAASDATMKMRRPIDTCSSGEDGPHGLASGIMTYMHFVEASAGPRTHPDQPHSDAVATRRTSHHVMPRVRDEHARRPCVHVAKEMHTPRRTLQVKSCI